LSPSCSIVVLCVRFLLVAGNMRIEVEVLRNDVDIVLWAWGSGGVPPEVAEVVLLLEEPAHLALHVVGNASNGLTRGDVLDGGRLAIVANIIISACECLLELVHGRLVGFVVLRFEE
jgi:hypothetical protein